MTNHDGHIPNRTLAVTCYCPHWFSQQQAVSEQFLASQVCSLAFLAAFLAASHQEPWLFTLEKRNSYEQLNKKRVETHPNVPFPLTNRNPIGRTVGCLGDAKDLVKEFVGRGLLLPLEPRDVPTDSKPTHINAKQHQDRDVSLETHIMKNRRSPTYSSRSAFVQARSRDGW